MGRATDVNPSNNGDLRHYHEQKTEASLTEQPDPTGPPEPPGASERRMTGRLAAAIFWGERGLGTWVLLVSMVSASVGVLFFGGAVLGGLVANLLGYRQGQLTDAPPVLVGAAAGGLAGVWIGSWVGVRLTGGGGRRRLIASGVGATLGLLLAVVLASFGSRSEEGSTALLTILAIAAPGLGAVLGDELQARLKSLN